MIAAGLWKDRRARLKPVHQPRYRRDCLGELIQIDGSEHWWFEGRGPQCTLLVYIDDATSLAVGEPLLCSGALAVPVANLIRLVNGSESGEASAR
jgi:hypothetical protein